MLTHVAYLVVKFFCRSKTLDQLITELGLLLVVLGEMEKKSINLS